MEALIWIGLTALLIATPFYYPRWRLRRALALPLPAEAVAILRRNIPVYRAMPAALQQQLQRLVVQFLHQKKFTGCEGLEVTDEMAVTIAGQACLLLLNRPQQGLSGAAHHPGLSQRLRGAPAPKWGRAGVVTPGHQSMLGESWDDGRVILSWDDVQRGAGDWTDGHNNRAARIRPPARQRIGPRQRRALPGQPGQLPRMVGSAGARLPQPAPQRHVPPAQRDGPLRRHQPGRNSLPSPPKPSSRNRTRWPSTTPSCLPNSSKYYRVDPREWMAAPPPPPPPEPADAAVFLPRRLVVTG